MGTVANDLITGRACNCCGQYFENPEDDNSLYEHGYPVLCDECWEPGDDLPKADVNTL